MQAIRGLEAIAECARGIGDVQVRNLGTIGGSLVHADPASDMPRCCSRSARVVQVRSTDGREVASPSSCSVRSRRHSGAGARDGHRRSLRPARSGSAYASVEHPASGFALAAPPRSSGRRRDGRARPASARHRSAPAGDVAIARRRDLRRSLRLRGVPPRPRTRRGRALRSRAHAPRGRMSDTSHRRRAAAHRRARQGDGATRFAADGYVHGLLHARPSSRPRRTHGSRASTGAARSRFPASSRCSPRGSPDRVERHRPHLGAARRERGRASPASRSRSSSPRARRGREDGAELVVVDYEPLPAVVDVEAAMEPGARSPARVEEADDEAGDLESIHAGVDHGQEDDPGEELSGNVLDRITRESGTSRPPSLRATRPSRARSGRRGSTRHTSSRRSALPGSSRPGARRLDEHTGLVRHAARARTRVRPPSRPGSA
jgi:hypothetical protein